MKQTLLSLMVAGLIWSPFASAAGDASAGESKAGVCAGCHGQGGNSTNPAWPNLAGQNAKYLAKQLADLKSGETRSDATMGSMAAPLSEQDMQDLGAYFATQKVKIGNASSEDLAMAGERLYRGGNSESKVPACMGCHGPSGGGTAQAGFPALSGQHAAYTMKALKDFASGARQNDPSKMMRDIAERMTDAEIKAVSEYVAGLH